jgi:signal transduction histidine kinase
MVDGRGDGSAADATDEPSGRARRLHDLRQPLSAILAAASALKLDPALEDSKRERLIQIVIDNAERLSEMLEQHSTSD